MRKDNAHRSGRGKGSTDSRHYTAPRRLIRRLLMFGPPLDLLALALCLLALATLPLWWGELS